MMLPAKPNWFWAVMGMMALLAMLFISNGMWAANQYYIYIGVGMAWLLSLGSNEPQKILLEEAERIALNEMKRRKREGHAMPDGALKIVPEMKVAEEGNVLTGRKICIESQGDERKQFIVTVPLFKERDGSVDRLEVTARDEWTTSESPNVWIEKPESLPEYIRLNEQIRRKMMEKAEAS